MYEWVINIKHMYGFNDYSTLSALKFFDKFVALNKLVPVEMHHLIAMTCLGLAVKMHEQCILDFDQAADLCFRESGYQYTTEMFVQAEF